MRKCKQYLGGKRKKRTNWTREPDSPEKNTRLPPWSWQVSSYLSLKYLQNLPTILNYTVDHWKTKTEDYFKNPSRGTTSTIPRLPERFGGQDSSRLAGGGGPGRGEQVGQQGREDESSATGGEETDRSTSTALTSAGLLTDWEGPWDPCIPSYSFAIVLKHNSLTLP